MPTRRAVLQSVAALATGLPARRSIAADISVEMSLGQAAASRGLLFGTATANFELRQPDFAAALKRDAKILVPEYELKRNLTEPERSRFNFVPANNILSFARANAMQFRGHPLVWHKANPPWLEAALMGPRDDTLLRDYVVKAATQFRGQMHSWDVVNEAIDPDAPRNLRQSAWLKMFGSSYIDTAFHLARETDLHAMLVYNDWGCEGAGARHDRFRAATLDFLASALKRGAPIHALGLQGHLQAYGPPIDQAKLRDFLSQVQAMGLKILVTEFDVDDHGGPLDAASRDHKVADAARRFLDVVLDCPATIALLTWGLSDRYVQYPYDPDERGWMPRTLPLDISMRPKPLWRAILTSLLTARKR